MMTEHHARRDGPACEACLCCCPFFVGGLTAIPQGTPLAAIGLAHVPVMPR